MTYFTKSGVLLMITILIVATNAQSGKVCRTPNGERARCISIYSCSILYDVVTTNDPDQRAFLRESQCGYTQEPLVCCGSSDNYKPQEVTKKPNVNRPQTTSDRFNVLPDRNSCGIQSADRILDGEVTALDEFPWMALLQYRKSNGNLVFSCGGTLISSRYILTAAHCITGQIRNKIGPVVSVRLGEWNTDQGKDCVTQFGFERCNEEPMDVGIEDMTPHESYNDRSIHRYNDIALIRLSREVPFSNFVKPICLPSTQERSRIGSRLTVAGWGRTEYSNNSTTKLKLLVPVVDDAQCLTRFRSAGVSISPSQLCAGGEKGRDSCNGDSGGPLMSTFGGSERWYLEGVVSFGARCGSEGWPGIYTRVSDYIDWINDHVKN